MSDTDILDENLTKLIKNFEGFSHTPYQLPSDVLTIGYGHAIKEDEHYNYVTHMQAEELLYEDLKIAYDCVKKHVKVQINKLQIQALISFIYNIGKTQFANSTLLIRLNNNEINFIPHEFKRWIYHNGKILPGLVKRRMIEANWFLGIKINV